MSERCTSKGNLTRSFLFHVDTRVDSKSWGYEKIIRNDDYCMKVMSIGANQGCSMHYHISKTETFYVTVGEIKVEFVDPDVGRCYSVKLRTGEAVTIFPGQSHRFKAGPLGAEFIEASTHDESRDSYRVCASNLGESEWRYGSTELKEFRKEDNPNKEKEG